MKLYRNAIILVVIAGLLVGAYFLISSKKPENTESGVKEDVINVINYTTDKVASVTITSTNGTFVLTQKEGTWTLTSPTDIKSDPNKLSSIVISGISVVADKIVEENAQDLVKYGLDKPAVVKVKLKDGTEKSMEIGSKTPTKGGYYVKVTGENKVYVVGAYTCDSLLTDRNGYKSSNLFGDITPDMFTAISMDRGGKNLFSSKLNATGKTWDMLSPLQATTNTSALTPMFQALVGTTVKEYVEENPSDLSKYGLDQPSYAFDFDTTTGGAFTLMLGDDKTKGSETYAMLKGRSEVFTIDSSAYTFLDKPLKEILDLFAYIVNIDQVTKIELTMDGKTDVMTLDVFKDKEGKNDTDKDKFTFNGKDATGKDDNDDQPFRKFYQSLIGISLDEVDLSGAKPADVNPEISINYTLKTGSMKVDIVSKDENFYYVFRNGEYANLLLKKTKVDFGVQGMKDSYKMLVDFLAKK